MFDRWIASLTKEEKGNQLWFLTDDLESGGKLFGTQIVKTVSLLERESVIKERDGLTKKGKILINYQ